MRTFIPRRQFLKQMGVAVSAPYFAASTSLGTTQRPPPSDRIGLAVIGLKKMGRPHVRNLLGFGEVQIVAVCDVDRTAREDTRREVEAHYGALRRDGSFQGCAAYNEYERIMSRPDVDAVVIAVPDHWHALIAIAACRAGKDVYCEKPLSRTVREARAMVDAARRHGRVFQTGSQQRSGRGFRYACELVRNGRIGDLHSVHVDVGPASSDVYLPAQPVPEGLDYDRWLGPAPWQPYHKLRCGSYYEDGWRRIRDYSGGKMTDWGAHHFDIAQWGLGMDDSGPVEIIPPGGDDVKQLTYRYANGVTVVKGGANGIRFVGTKGEIEVNRGHLRSAPEAIIQQPIGRDDLRLYRSPGHHRDWLECIRTRRRPICDVEIGCRSATVCHLGNIALWTRRSIRWDPVRERIIGDDEAARWLDRPKRAPYTM